MFRLKRKTLFDGESDVPWRCCADMWLLTVYQLIFCSNLVLVDGGNSKYPMGAAMHGAPGSLTDPSSSTYLCEEWAFTQ